MFFGHNNCLVKALFKGCKKTCLEPAKLKMVPSMMSCKYMVSTVSYKVYQKKVVLFVSELTLDFRSVNNIYTKIQIVILVTNTLFVPNYPISLLG